MPSRRAVPVPSRSALALLRLGLTGALAGGLVAVTGCNWTLWLHEDGLEICDDDYADCMADAQSEADEQWCVTEVQSCYEECEAGWDDEADDQGDQAEEQDEQGNDESTSHEHTPRAIRGRIRENTVSRG